MSKILKFQKGIFSIIFILMLLITLVACGDKDQDAVDEAIEQVTIAFATGDNANSVTQNVVLLTTVGELSIVWTSNNTSAISNTGQVTRTFSDVTVKLTATIVKGDAEATKDFDLVVKGYDVQAALNAIQLSGDNISYNTTTQTYTAVGNFTIPTTVQGLTIEWESTLPQVISATGVVVIPEYGQANATVTLIATINGIEKEFTIVVPASTVEPDQTMVYLEQARGALLIPGVADGVSKDLVLPMSVGTNGVTVTWSSNLTSVISNTGKVVRQGVNTDVVLTATLHLNNQTVTKVFSLTVLAAVDYEDVDNIAAAIALSLNDEDELVRTYVRIPNVLVIGRSDDGAYIADETGILFIYSFGRTNPLNVGEVYDVIGMTDRFAGTWQLNNSSTYNTRPVVFTPSDGPAPVITPTVATSVTDMLSNHEVPGDAFPDFVITYYRLTAKVRIQSTTDNYGTILVDPDYDGADVPAQAGSAHTEDGVVVYYQSNKKAFDLLDGETITLNVVLHGYRSDRFIYYVYFVGDVSEIELSLDETETLNLIETTIKADVNSAYTEDATLNLRSTMFGADITWVSSHPDIIDPTTKALTVPAEGQTEVTLTATIDLNGTEKEVVIKVLVGELQVIDIAEARTKAVGTKVKVSGVITGLAYSDFYSSATVYIQDETGGIMLHQLANSAALKVGDIIELEGLIGASSGNIRLQSGANIVVKSSNNAFVAEEVESTDTFIDFQGQYVYVTGTLKAKPSISTTGWSDSTVVVVGDVEVKIYIHHPGDMVLEERNALIATLEALEAGDTISVFGPMGWYNGPQIIAYKASDVVVGGYVDLDDQEKADAAAAAIMIPTIIETAGTYALPGTGIHGSTITWISSNIDVYNAATGVVVLPSSGNVEVTLTAEVTVLDKTASREIVVIVGEYVRTIENVREATVGQIVTFEGLVTYAWTHSTNTKNAFISDETAGIYIFSIPEADAGKVLVGSIIKVTGTRNINRGNIQITNVTKVEVVSTDNTVTPVVVSDYADYEDNVGRLVTLTGYLNTAYGASTQNFTLLSETGSVIIRFNQASQNINLTTATIGSKVTVTAGAAMDNGLYQILIFYAADATFVASTEAERGTVAAANFVAPSANAEVVANITLPTTGLFDSIVTWVSDKPEVISNAGVVTRPANDAADEVVTLTYELKIGEGVYATGTVVYTVLKETEGEEPEGTLMIYEAYGGGGNSGATYKNDYIVLYNGTSSDIDLTGYSIQYASATGTSWNNKQNLSGTIVAGGFYVIQANAGTGGTLDLPRVDITANISMAGTNFKIALVNSLTELTGANPSSDPTVVDFLGVGSANGFEGTGTASVASNTTSVKRASFVDTNDNSNDFVTGPIDLSYLTAE